MRFWDTFVIFWTLDNVYAKFYDIELAYAIYNMHHYQPFIMHGWIKPSQFYYILGHNREVFGQLVPR